MKIILDTNILFNNWFLDSPQFRLLFDGLVSLPATLVIPEVVLDETVNKFREEFEEASQKLDEAKRKILHFQKDASPAQPAITSGDEEALHYQAWLLEMCEEAGIEITPYPRISHKKVVARELQRKSPFKSNGAGYRDYLIWESIRSLAWSGHEALVFVSNNSKDFGKAPNLSKDFEADILNPGRLDIYESLHSFNEKMIKPNLQMWEGARDTLIAGEAPAVDLLGWLNNNLVSILREEELGIIVAGWPDGVGSSWPTEVVKYGEIEVEEVRKLESQELIAHIRILVEVELSLDISWEDYSEHEEVREWAGPVEEIFDSSSTYEQAELEVELNLTICPVKHCVTSFEVIGLSGEYGFVKTWDGE